MLSLALVPLLAASAFAGLPYLSHERDTRTGEYAYSYHDGPSSKTEYRELDGTTSGTYSYLDTNGIVQTVVYTGGKRGFHAAGTNIVAPEDPEVTAQRAAHLAQHARLVVSNRLAYLAALNRLGKSSVGIRTAPISTNGLPLAIAYPKRVNIPQSPYPSHSLAVF